jgi:hypothetical protein
MPMVMCEVVKESIIFGIKLVELSLQMESCTLDRR